MKKIITTDVSDPTIGQPFTASSLDFLQDAIRVVALNLSAGIRTTSNPGSRELILWGCEVTDLGSGNFSCSAGAIMDTFGEIYEVDAVASTPITTFASFDRVTTNDPTADPLTFTDGIARNVHKIRKATYVDNSLVSDYIGAYASFQRESMTLEKVIDIGDWNMDTTANLDVAHGLPVGVIRSFEIVIRDDAGLLYKLVDDYTMGGSPDGRVHLDATNVRMQRRAGGIFDTTSFDSTSYNRGWITIRYAV